MDTYEAKKYNSLLEDVKKMIEDFSISEEIKITSEDVENIEDEISYKTEPKGLSSPCGPLGPGDMINQFLDEVIESFVGQGLEVEKAEDVVFNSLSEFIESGKLDDTPDVDEPDEVKKKWISSFDKLMESKFGE